MRITIAVFMILILAGLFFCDAFAVEGKDSPQGAYINIALDFNKDVFPHKYGVMYPSYVIWVQDKESGAVQTIYATHKLAADKWLFAKERPSAAPVWYGFKEKGFKGSGQPDVDVISSATPTDKTQNIHWPVPKEFLNKELVIWLEANVAFDYNDYYKKDATKSDTGYSDVNGQPSIVWQAALKTGSEPVTNLNPKIIGHGHVLGADHKVDPDMSHITTAKDLFLRIRFDYAPALK